MPTEPTKTPPAAAAKTPRKKRRALRIGLAVLATPVVIGALGLGYLHTGAGKAKVRGAIEARLGERIDGEVKVDTVDYALFGEVKIGDVHLKDKAGVEVISLTALTIRPSWSDLFRGRIVLERVDLSGVALHVVKDADGGSNLKRLIKPRAEPEDPNKKPLDKRIVVKELSISEVGADILQPDGTRVAVTGAQVHGALSILPSDRMVDVEIGRIALAVSVDKGQGGLKLGVTGFETGLTVKLDHGLGKATLHPLKGHVAITLPDRPERGFDLGLEGFTADIGEDGLGVSLDKLIAGAVALASVEVRGRLKDGQVDGKQDADMLGLKISGAQVNEFLGKEVLLGDIDIETHIHGPPDKIEIGTKITTLGATATVDGAIGIGDPANPSFDVALAITDIDTDKVMAPAMAIAKVGVEKVEVWAKGQGTQVATADGSARVKVTGITTRGVRIDGVELKGRLEKGILKVESLDANALGQHVSATGEVEIANKRIDLTIGVDGDVGDVLGRLKAAGIPIKSALPRGAVRLAPGDLQVHARGLLGGIIDVEASAKKIGVLGGTVGLEARASVLRHDPPLADGKKASLTAMDADLRIRGIKLSSILAMRGKKLTGIDGAVSGDVHVEGTPQSPRAKLSLGLETSRSDGGKTLRFVLDGNVTPTLADLHASLTGTGEATELFGLRAKLPLSLSGQKKGLDPYRAIDVHAQLPKKKLRELWAFVPSTLFGGTLQTLPEGDIELALDVTGTAAKPDGKLHTTVTAKAVPGFEGTQKVNLDATLQPAESGLVAKTNVDVWLDQAKARLARVEGSVDLSRSPVLGPPEIAYRATVQAGPVGPGDLPGASDKLKAIGGSALALIEVQGNKQDLTGKVTASVEGMRPTGSGQVGLGLLATLGENDTSVDLKVRVADTAEGEATRNLLTLAGKVGLGGNKLFAQLKDREHLDPSLALVLDIPKRALASLASLRPNLAKAPGNLLGSIAVNGTAKMPLARGAIKLDDVERVDGKMGGLGLALDVTRDQILATLGAGVAEAAQAPLQIAVVVPREPLSKMGEGALVPVDAAIRGKGIDIRTLVPAVLMADTKVGVSGTLDWNMDVKVGLQKKVKGAPTEVATGTVTGLMDLHGAAIALPGTKRAYHDVNLLLKADEKGLHLDALRAKESDLEVKDRALTVKAEVALDKLKPTTAALSIAAEKWLLFGPRALGFIDAPRGVLTLEAQAKAELDKPIKHASIEVKKLDLFAPERFERAHQPEDVQAGDLVFLDEGKVAKGKLPVPESMEEKARPKKVEPEPAAKPGEETGFDIDVRVAEGAHVLQAPIDLSPKGELHVKIRPEGRTVSGELIMTRGALSLGGKPHPLEKGSLTFTKELPKGYMDLYFARPMRASALRDISEASAGESLRIHMFGPLADRTTVLSGAGSPGALWDVLAMHNTGRQRNVTEPDLPKSVAIDFPQHDSLLVLSFLSVNLPHLLFLDRFAAWADPYDDARAYGKLTHFEAERFLAGDSVRVRAGTRPSAAGRSDTEVEIDYLFVNVPRMLFGVGLTGGTRGGGGPGLVWEWSSRD